MAPKLRLAQLPIPQPARGAASGNVPLAAGCLAVAATDGAGAPGFEIETLSPTTTDELGDTLLAEHLAEGEPTLVGLSLYLWNSERSLHLAREIKRRSPATTVLVGGPEVGPDNPFVLEAEGWDVAVTGEAEEVFPSLLGRLLAGQDTRALPGVAVRDENGPATFTPALPAAFPLTRFPSPYLERWLPVDPRRSTYVETVRGCRSHCSFCSYPRGSASLRALDAPQSTRLVERLAEAGAGEIVFLDPTFNHRPELTPLLDSLAAVRRRHGVSFFAEVRAEGLTESVADQLAAAGFHRLEIGLQSVSPATLARTRRGGSAGEVARAARLLRSRGIELQVDLILGLPGDRPQDVRAGVDFLLEHDLGASAQVFLLSVLPGTAQRAGATRDGLVFDPLPPYRVRRSADLDEGQLLAALLEAEDLLGRRLDELPRPFLCDADPTRAVPDVFSLDLDAAAAPQAAPPGAAHVALWLTSQDLSARADAAERVLAARLSVDPFATLDLVLAPRAPFPPALLQRLRQQCSRALPGYAGRALRHRGEDGARRLAVVLRRNVSFPADWVAAVQDVVPVFREMTLEEALPLAERLGDDLPGARILDRRDEAHAQAWAALAAVVDPDQVVFADRRLELQWVERVLGYGER